MTNLYRPLELSKLCANVIIEQIYNKNYYIFYEKLINLGLPDDINKVIIERYNIINHIMIIDNKNK